MFYISVLIIMLKVEYNDLILRKWNVINFVYFVHNTQQCLFLIYKLHSSSNLVYPYYALLYVYSKSILESLSLEFLQRQISSTK